MKGNNKYTLNEGMYDFYEFQGDPDSSLADKILDYYLSKIKKYGKESLTDVEKTIFKDAQNNNLAVEKPTYARDKVTGDIMIDDRGMPVTIEDQNKVYPGVPFLTSRGMGKKTEQEVINARCYWDRGSSCKNYYVFDSKMKNDQNPYGIIIYKTESKTGKSFGAFMVPRNKELKPINDIWDKCAEEYDYGVVLTRESLDNFIKFYNLFHGSKKGDINELTELYEKLKKYPR